MTELQVFQFQGREVRTVRSEAGTRFVAADVCRELAIENNRNVIARMPADEKGVQTVDTLGGPQEMAVVTEPGLYRLLFTSRKPEAEVFRRWVLHEVLPTIRQTGSYATANATVNQVHFGPGQHVVTTVEALRQLAGTGSGEALGRVYSIRDKIRELWPNAPTKEATAAWRRVCTELLLRNRTPIPMGPAKNAEFGVFAEDVDLVVAAVTAEVAEWVDRVERPLLKRLDKRPKRQGETKQARTR